GTSVAARCLEFIVLTGARLAEATGAMWSEIEERTWTVPANRMKGGREHKVPLSNAAMAVLEAMPRMGDFVFPGMREGQPVGARTIQDLVREIGGGKTHHRLPSFFPRLGRRRHNLPPPGVRVGPAPSPPP